MAQYEKQSARLLLSQANGGPWHKGGGLMSTKRGQSPIVVLIRDCVLAIVTFSGLFLGLEHTKGPWRVIIICAAIIGLIAILYFYLREYRSRPIKTYKNHGEFVKYMRK